MSNKRNRPPVDDDEVGYRKPPKPHRFKNGQSGNPRGRPKGSKSRKPVLSEESLRGMVLKEARRTDHRRRGRPLRYPDDSGGHHPHPGR